MAFDQLLRTLPDERQVTIERILTRAGVSLGSFYEYFTDKDALVGALVERATRDNFQSLLASYDEDPPTDIASALHFFAERVVDTYLQHPARTRIWLAGVGRLQLLGTITLERDRFARELATRASRLLPARDDIELASVMMTVCDAIIGIVTGEIYRSQPRPRHEVIAAMVAVSHGLLEQHAAPSCPRA